MKAESAGVRERMRAGMTVAAAAVLLVAMTILVPEVDATRWIVGANQGWTNNVNYTIWAKDKHFYNGDWLCKFFSLCLS